MTSSSSSSSPSTTSRRMSPVTTTSSAPLQWSSLEINDYSDDETEDDDDEEYDDDDEEDFDGHVEPWNVMDVRHRRRPVHRRCGIIFAVTTLFVLVVSLFVVALLSMRDGSCDNSPAAVAAKDSSTAEEPMYGTAHLPPNEYLNVRIANGYESVLVTGGLGFIGSHVVELLLHRGFIVTILDDESNGHNHNNAAVELVPKDITVITDLPSLPNINNKEESTTSLQNYNNYYTHVVHLAAAISVSESIVDPNKYERINYGGSQKLLTWIHRYNEHIISTSSTANATTTTSSTPSSSSSHPLMTIRKIVAASSAAIYGNPDSTLLPLQENAPYGGVSPYADTKYRMEQLLHDFTTAATATEAATTWKVSATALRFFNVYGPRQDPNNPYSGVISLFLQMAVSNSDITILGDGYMTRDFVYVKDVARAIVSALLQEDDKNDKFNVYNVCTGTSITINTLSKLIKSIMKSSSKIIHVEPRVGDVRESECNPTLAKVGIGFETVISQENGIEKTVEWFRSLI